jgi:hypothetical protein
MALHGVRERVIAELQNGDVDEFDDEIPHSRPRGMEGV